MPTPPENCTVSHHTAHSVQIRCEVPEQIQLENPTYLLQVYDARTRLLLGTATSNSPTNLMINNLPNEPEGDGQLLLFVRTMTSKSTSEATILYTNGVSAVNQLRGGKTQFSTKRTNKDKASTPVIPYVRCVVVYGAWCRTCS